MKKIFLSFIIVLLTACASLSISPRQTLTDTTSPAEGVIGYFSLSEGKIIKYEIHLPDSWAGKYVMSTEDNIARFDYNASPIQTLFWLRAFTETQWQQVQMEPGHGAVLFTQDGIVFVYNVALDNPYSGSQVDEFQQMVGEVKNVVSSLTISKDFDSTDSEKARDALQTFFELLSNKQYAEAVDLFGGSYETLISFNPDLKLSDKVTLWQNGCQINGLQCLPIRSARLVQENNGVFVFMVEFNNPDGSLFVRGPCCGYEETQSASVSQFQVRLQKTLDGKFLVLDLPVYVP